MWSFLACVALGLQLSKAQNELVLSGSSLKSEDIATKVDAIFVGEITAIGFGNTKEKGESSYRGVQVKVLQVLRGAVDTSITVTLYVVGRMDFHEDPPKVGSSYIFFAKKAGAFEKDPYIVLKLLPATDANIAKVKALIAAAPASK
jgi:hypothetical protein